MSSSNSLSQKATTLAKREAQKAAELAKSDLGTVGNLGKEVIQSGGYLYPIWGIFYVLRNRQLLAGLWDVLYKAIVTSAGVLAAMFFFTYLPQVAALALVSGPLAFIAAVPVVLAESYAIIQFINKAFYLRNATTRIFDAVLVEKGHGALVEKGRKIGTSSSGARVLGSAILKPISSRFSTEGMVRYVLSLPLNAIPAVGTVFWLGYNGRHSGPGSLGRYFQLKGMRKEETKAFVEERRGALTAMGAVSLALELVPIVSPVFMFTSAVGAALYAADQEKQLAKGKVQPEIQGKVDVGRGSEL